MRKRVACGIGTAGGAALVASAVIGTGVVVNTRQRNAAVDALLAARHVTRPAMLTEADLHDLPTPVQRWLHTSGMLGRDRPVTVRLTQEGQFQLREDTGWIPFTAEQYYTTTPPGFVWAVSMHMVPLLSITGRDQYVNGEGSIHMRLLSLIPIADKRGGVLNQGALLRYLNEMMWFPAAAVHPCITWEAVDATSARATIRDRGTTATATFIFDPEGRMINMQAERYNDARGKLEWWSTPISAYGEFDGIRVPIEGEGIWHYATGSFPYIRLRITALEYNPPLRAPGHPPEAAPLMRGTPAERETAAG